MTLSEQAAILLEANAIKPLQPPEIVRWAQAIIATTSGPPCWLVELSILRSPNRQDFISRLREHALVGLAMRRRIQVVIAAHRSGLIPLLDTLSRLMNLTLFERNERPLDILGENLVDALVYWDCEENPTVIDSSLQAKFAGVFDEYLTDAEDVAAILPWK